MRRIGLIAGGGQFPIIFSKKAKSKGYAVHAVAYLKEAEEALNRHVDAVEWIHLGQLNRLIRFFKQHDIREAVLLGTIQKTKMFSDVKPDLKAISLVARMRNTHDDGMLTAFADLLEKEGILIRPSTFLLPEMVASEGCWTRRKPSRSETRDIDLGWEMAKAIGRLDIGQCVVVKGGSVLAVEAIDGTDATIERGGRLGGEGSVVVKVCKPIQDKRFDMPAVGTTTVSTMIRAGITVLALDAGNAVVFEKEEMVRLADENGITITAILRS